LFFVAETAAGVSGTPAHAPEYVGGGEQGVGQDLRVERVPSFAGYERRPGVVRDLQVFADVRVRAQRDHRHVHLVPRDLDVVPRVVRQVSFQAVPAHVQDFLPDVACNPTDYGRGRRCVTGGTRARHTLPTTKCRIISSMNDGPLPRWRFSRVFRFSIIESDPNSSMNWVSARCDTSTSKPAEQKTQHVFVRVV